MAHEERDTRLTVGLPAVAITDFHRSSADAADTDVGLADDDAAGAARAWGRAVHRDVACLQVNMSVVEY